MQETAAKPAIKCIETTQSDTKLEVSLSLIPASRYQIPDQAAGRPEEIFSLMTDAVLGEVILPSFLPSLLLSLSLARKHACKYANQFRDYDH